MSSYAIIIENKNTTTGPPKLYNIYTEKPGISGDTGLQSMFSVVWYKSLGIPRGGRDTFRFTTNVYAFIGSSSEYSTQLAAGHTVNIINSAVAKIDPRRQKGSQFLLTKDFDINDSQANRAKAGAFDFCVESGFDEPNKYVVGVAQEEVGGRLTPVAVVDLKSSADYVFEPKRKVYVSCTSVDRGEIFTPPTTEGQFAEIEYKDGRKTALVTEKAGEFTITVPPEASFALPTPTILAILGVEGPERDLFIEEVTGIDLAGREKADDGSTARVFKGKADGRDLWLVDCPSLSLADAAFTDAVQAALAKDSSPAQRTIGGVIYLHDITDINVKEHATKNLSLFKKLLGPESQDNIMIVTTLWDMLRTADDGKRTEAELKAAYGNASSSATVNVRRIQDSSNDESIYVSIVREFIAVATISTSIDGNQFAKMSLQDLVNIIAGKDRELADLRAKFQASVTTHAMELEKAVTEKLHVAKELDQARKAEQEVIQLKDELQRHEMDRETKINILERQFDAEKRELNNKLQKLDVERLDLARHQEELYRTLARDLACQPLGSNGITPLHLAARRGQTELVRPLVEAGVPLEAKMQYIDVSTDRSYGTALHWASIEGHLAAAKALLDAGAQKETLNAWRRTPLHCAARFGHLEVVKLLVSRNANKEARRDTNETPLHFAVEENRYSVVEFLIDAKADINARGDRGTPLQFAYAKGHYQIAQLLVSRGGRK